MADKIAYIRDRRIFMANIDGKNSIELLGNTGETRINLRWTPDGRGLLYDVLMGVEPGNQLNLCQYYLPVQGNEAGGPVSLGCFGDIAFFPDMSRAIYGGYVDTGNQTKRFLSYMGTFDLDRVRSFLPIPRSPMLGGCNFEDGGWQTMISNDMQTFATILRSGSREILKLYQFRERCRDGLETIIILPGSQMDLKYYDSLGDISDFGWDGISRIVLHDNYKDTGFGDLHLYNYEMANAEDEIINPIRDEAGDTNQCCYQDAQFSPDGNYLLFVYSDNRTTEPPLVYYIPIDTLPSGLVYKPLPLPTFSNRNERIEPALREYKPGGIPAGGIPSDGR
jgi:hypothetical protein